MTTSTRPLHWSDLVPSDQLETFGEFWRELRQLGQRPRALLSGEERRKMDLLELLLDELVEGFREAIDHVGRASVPGLVVQAVDAVKDTRDLQRHYRSSLDPMMRRELPAIETRADEHVGRLGELLAAAKGGGS